MSYCPKCGEKLESTVKFCTKCGKKIVENDTTEGGKDKQPIVSSSDMNVRAATDAFSSTSSTTSKKSITVIIYVLHLLGIFFFITPLAAIIMNYIMRKDVANSWLESHFNWQIKTFWVGLLLSVIGAVTALFGIGIIILIIAGIWLLYRNIKGLLAINDNRAMDN
jgi:uncharacterized membrane protein